MKTDTGNLFSLTTLLIVWKGPLQVTTHYSSGLPNHNNGIPVYHQARCAKYFAEGTIANELLVLARNDISRYFTNNPENMNPLIDIIASYYYLNIPLLEQVQILVLGEKQRDKSVVSTLLVSGPGSVRLKELVDQGLIPASASDNTKRLLLICLTLGMQLFCLTDMEE
jgi:hypothetical protein